MMKVALACAALAAAAGLAHAQVWNEAGDAGELPGTAQTPMGSGDISTIFGVLNDDADMYLINIYNPAQFLATTSGNLTALDTQLFLFDASGMGVTHDDDDPLNPVLQSRITGTFVPAPGLYYLAIAAYDYDPISAGGEIWLDQPFGVERAPDGPGAGSAIAGWDPNSFDFGDYQIDIRGASFVPAPASLAILGLGGLVAGRRRR